MKTPEDQTSFEAEITSISFVDVDEIMILTGGLKARIHQSEYIQFYPIWKNGNAVWGNETRQEDVRRFIADRNIDLIGIKQETKSADGQHWRWAPANGCENPPHNNPSYRWGFIASSIKRAIKRGDSFNFIGEEHQKVMPNSDMTKLSNLAQHISIDLHQMNFSIVMMAEHLHREILQCKPECTRYSHIRNLDLSAHVHSFFQAYSAARDHYAQFLAVQISKTSVCGEKVDSMSGLLNSVDPDNLRELQIAKTLEAKKLLSIGNGRKKHDGKERFVYTPKTWLSYTNRLRNRFTHGSPYGTLPEEDIMEIYSPENDPSIYLAKSFLEKEDCQFHPNLLRTVNGLYQNICGLFLSASELSGYKDDPPLIVV